MHKSVSGKFILLTFGDFPYREEEIEEDFEEQEGENELDASTLLEAIPSEQEQQLPELEEQPIQPNKTSVMTQTEGIKNPTRFTVPKHVPEYGPHRKFSRRYEEDQYQEELGLQGDQSYLFSRPVNSAVRRELQTSWMHPRSNSGLHFVRYQCHASLQVPCWPYSEILHLW